MAGNSFNPIIAGILVCIALVFLCLILFNKNKTRSKESRLETEHSKLEATDAQVQTGNKDLSDDSLVAVLTAAVMASMQSSPNIKIRVTSFRRIPQSSPVWNTIGRRERIENKL